MVFLMAFSLSMAAYILVEILLSMFFMKSINLINRLEGVEYLEKVKEDVGYTESSITTKLVNSLLSRVLEIIELIIPRNPRAFKNIEAQLKLAGLNMTPLRYSALIVFRIIGFAILFAVIAFLMKFAFAFIVLAAFFGVYCGYTVSRFAITRSIRKRKEDIYHQL